ncbi:MAG: type II toxin-antitoxin system VapC family toxin [Methylococcales bacterium]
MRALRVIGQTNIAASIITKAELLYGARDKQEPNRINNHLKLCRCYPVTVDISDLFIRLIANYSRHRPSIPDMLIAATAITHDLELSTLNTKDFKFIPGMRLYSGC